MPDTGTPEAVSDSEMIEAEADTARREIELLIKTSEGEMHPSGNPQMLAAILEVPTLPTQQAKIIARYTLALHSYKRKGGLRCWWHEVLQAAAGHPNLPLDLQLDLYEVGEWYIHRHQVNNPTTSLEVLKKLTDPGHDPAIRKRAQERLKFHGIHLPVPDVPVIRIGA